MIFTGYYPDFIHYLDENIWQYVQHGNEYLAKKACKEILASDYSILFIQIPSPKFTILTYEVVVGFADKIASVGKSLKSHFKIMLFKHCLLGGLLGLFTGMSLLSIFEIFFWMVKIVTSPFTKGSST